MQLTKLLPLSLLASTVLSQSDNSTSNSTTTSIVTAITKIQTKTLALNSTVASWRGPTDPLGTLPIILDSTALLSAINDGTFTASRSPNLTLAQVLSVAAAITPLVADVQSTLTTTVDAKPKFSKLLLTPVIWLNLVTEKEATDKFSAAVIAKVPSALQPLASSIVAPVDTAFESAITAYQ
jgi:hypothetical protein